jgi:fatty acid synthase subunit alpha
MSEMMIKKSLVKVKEHPPYVGDMITYCCSQPSPPSSFAAHWVGKEAVFKSLGMKSKGAAAAMKEIEIVNDESGIPTVHLHVKPKPEPLLRASPKS